MTGFLFKEHVECFVTTMHNVRKDICTVPASVKPKDIQAPKTRVFTAECDNAKYNHLTYTGKYSLPEIYLK